MRKYRRPSTMPPSQSMRFATVCALNRDYFESNTALTHLILSHGSPPRFSAPPPFVILRLCPVVRSAIHCGIDCPSDNPGAPKRVINDADVRQRVTFCSLPCRALLTDFPHSSKHFRVVVTRGLRCFLTYARHPPERPHHGHRMVSETRPSTTQTQSNSSLNFFATDRYLIRSRSTFPGCATALPKR